LWCRPRLRADGAVDEEVVGLLEAAHGGVHSGPEDAVVVVGCVGDHAVGDQRGL